MENNYEQLVKALRYVGIHQDCNECEAGRWHNEFDCCLFKDAADAIEELQAEVESMDESCKKQLVAMASHVADLQAEVERLEPKRGKWIIDGAYTYNLRELNGEAYEPVYRCSCCNRQTESYVRLDEPKMPEDADFPEYCPHCGAKMEAQDG